MATGPAFQRVMSADGLGKTSSAKQPQKFTAPQFQMQTGERDVLVEQFFQPEYHPSLHVCISQQYQTFTHFTAKSKTAFKSRIQGFAAK